MADAKISALSPLSNLAAGDQLVAVIAGTSNSIRGDHMPGFELDYVENTSTATITATSGTSPQTWIDGNAVSLDGSTRIKIEAWCELAEYNISGGELLLQLLDGASNLGIFGEIESPDSNLGGGGIYAVRFLTPSAGSHTFHVMAWKSSGSGTAKLYADVGGSAGARVPAWYRITVA